MLKIFEKLFKNKPGKKEEKLEAPQTKRKKPEPKDDK